MHPAIKNITWTTAGTQAPRRVQIPAYSDRWMMGDRFGEIVKVTRRKGLGGFLVDVAHVKLDISGKVCRFPLDDCRGV